MNKTFNTEIRLIELRDGNSHYASCAWTIQKMDRAERCDKTIYSMV